MSDFNTMYFAGLAGARGDQSNRNRAVAEENYDAAMRWKSYAKELEYLLADWKDAAVNEGARSYTKDQLLQEHYGVKASELAGGREAYEERVEANKPLIRKDMNAE